MRNKSIYVIAVLLAVFLTGCHSTKTTVTHKAKKEKAPSKEAVLFDKSDKIFEDLKQNKSGHLNSYTLDYVNRYKHIAIEDMLLYKIPASITLAQGVLESGSGRSELSKKSNNHFGIKCHKDWNGKKVRYDDDKKRECFRKYPHPEGSFDDHSIFLTTRSRYDFLFDLKPDNYKAWAKGLKKAGYATDRKYPAKLIKIIEDYQLYEYDALVLNKKGNYKPENKKYEVVSNRTGAFIIVSKGDTLYSIARNNSLSVEQLKSFNKLLTNDISVGQKLYLSN